MKTRLTLKPGDNGAKKLHAKYGARLIAVRYRYDDRQHLRIKTVELVEEQLPWTPPLPAGRKPNELVLIRIGWDEEELRQAVKRLGATWQYERRLWRLPLGLVYEAGLEDRIVT
jgi:hypothetical protein